ncbi:BspA family leucine-rich repeat surface protein [Bdellovibrio sp. HCB337]|uniref:BspA family leucine-rich repeat surface protein n=1 Tax=Bdellovibrio sp. HCB337 TaxID=3394358 RepID=UPI0039A51029
MKNLEFLSLYFLLLFAGLFSLNGCTIESSIIDHAQKSLITQPTITIVGPAITSGDSTTSFVYTVNYADAATVSLADADITLGGTDTAGCIATVTGTGSTTRTVTVTGCTGDGTVNISIAANSAQDSLGNQALAYGPSSIANARNSFIASFDTSQLSAGSSANNAVELPLSDWTEYDFVITWGDGSSEPVIHTNVSGGGMNRTVTHTYGAPGVYDIKMKGTKLPYLKICDKNDKLKIQDVKQWGPNVWLSMQAMFANCGKVQISAADSPNLSAVTSLNSMFAGAIVFNSPIGDWDTSNVTDMQFMFGGAKAFNQPLGSWDTSSVTDMSGLFSGAEAFNQAIGTWNTSSAIDMSGMFFDAKVFNQNIGAWNTANVLAMNIMFSGAEAFNQPISNWNTSKVTTMYSMFQGAKNFNQPINTGAGGIWDTSKVVDMERMFNDAEAFNQDIGSWDISSVVYMGEMFSNARAFNKSIANWNTANVTDMDRMFANAIVYNQPMNTGAGGIWNTSNVTTMSAMFYGAEKFNQNIAGWNTANVTDMDYFMQNAVMFNQDLSAWNVSSVTTSASYASGATAWAAPNKPALP